MKYHKTLKQNNQNFKKAFTLIETLVSLAIFVVIFTIITLFARNTFYFKGIFSGGLTASDDARHILQPIANELRSASQSSLGSYPLEVVDNNELVFYSDINDDGLKERIRYFLNGNVFSRGVIKPTGSPLAYVAASEKVTALMSGVANGPVPIFSYYNTNYNGTNSPLTQPVAVENVRLIKIKIIIDANPSQPPGPFTVTTQISLRNLKDNL
jgi:prepilin-type N-terminal cleavage/methylation domain-containing protein